MLFWLLAYFTEGIKFHIPWMFDIHPFWHIFRFISLFVPVIVMLFFLLSKNYSYDIPEMKPYILGEYSVKYYLLNNGKLTNGDNNERTSTIPRL